MQYFLGIDVGGSKTHALIADENGQAVGFGQAGGGNHEVVGYPGLKQVLETASAAALGLAGLQPSDLSAAGFGLSGYDWPPQHEPIAAVIESLGFNVPFKMVNDALIGVLAGAEQGWGVAVVAGTGCNAWGWDAGRRVGRMSGCSTLFDESGGSFDLVQTAMWAVSRAWSKRGPQTALAGLFIKVTGARDLDDLIEGLALNRYYLSGELAPLVFQTAAAGDEVARQVLRRHGENLADLAIGIIHQLEIEGAEFEVVLVGSLWKGGPLLIEPARQAIQAVAPGARLVPLRQPPVTGGVLLGVEALGGPAGPAFRQRLHETTATLLAGL